MNARNEIVSRLATPNNAIRLATAAIALVMLLVGAAFADASAIDRANQDVEAGCAEWVAADIDICIAQAAE